MADLRRAGGDLAIVGAGLRSNAPPVPGATALLIRDGRIAAVADDASVLAEARAEGIPVRRVDGATVTPGLFDSHTHPLWAADVTAGIDLGGLETLADVRAAIAEAHATAPPGAWLRGWNLSYEPFRASGMHGALLEEVAPGRAVALICADLHTGLASPEALSRAGIVGAREFADASEIVVDGSGRPTGELREPSAYTLVFDAAPKPSREEERDRVRDMLRTLASSGLTGGAILDGSARTVELLAEIDERGELDQRLVVHHWHAVGDTDEDIDRVIAARGRRGRLWEAGGVKLFSDGVIDTGTAWLHEPDSCGDGQASFWPSWERYAEVVRAYHEAGMLIATHAVGDRAVSGVLDVFATLPARPGLPFHSIEHLEVLSDADVARLRGSGVTASMQPLHMQWRAADHRDNWSVRLGPGRDATGYRVRDVLEAGVTLVLGSDWPVAQYDPRLGMAWARGRRAPGDLDASVFEPEQRLSGEEALLAYTLWPARARGHADRGTIAVGAVADLTVWGSDPVTATADELPAVPILCTVVDGRCVFDASTFAG